MKVACRLCTGLDYLVSESVRAGAGIYVSGRDWAGSLYPCFVSVRLDTNKSHFEIKKRVQK